MYIYIIQCIVSPSYTVYCISRPTMQPLGSILPLGCPKPARPERYKEIQIQSHLKRFERNTNPVTPLQRNTNPVTPWKRFGRNTNPVTPLQRNTNTVTPWKRFTNPVTPWKRFGGTGATWTNANPEMETKKYKSSHTLKKIQGSQAKWTSSLRAWLVCVSIHSPLPFHALSDPYWHTCCPIRQSAVRLKPGQQLPYQLSQSLSYPSSSVIHPWCPFEQGGAAVIAFNSRSKCQPSTAALCYKIYFTTS